MRFFSIVGNSFGCSASGERLVSAARDGDFQEAKALLEYNPRLVRYSTFGVRNSPLHYSAAQGHHEIVSLLLESGVDINLRNYRGQTALMEACQYGHWEVVQTLIIFKANIHRADYVNGGTALHCAALNGHTRCIRLLLGDYLPSIPNLWKTLQDKSGSEESSLEFNGSALRQVINKPADGGITALHMAALKGHYETVQFLLDLGASVTVVIIEDGGTFDLIGAGSTPLHYAAAGGNAQCCQILIARGADLSAQNVKGLTPLMVARSWNRHWLDETLLTSPQDLNPEIFPSPCLSLPLFSVISIARECGWRRADMVPTCQDDPCAVCLERKCSVAAQGCGHEFCTQCALYLCTMTSGTTTSSSSSPTASPPGSIPCPLCRHSIVSFTKLPEAFQPLSHREIARTSFSLSLCACSCDSKPEEQAESQLIAPLCEPTPPLLHSSSSPSSSRVCPLGPSFRSSSCQRFPSVLNSAFCMGSSETADSTIGEGGSSSHRNLRNHLLMGRCLRPGQLRRSTSNAEGRSRAYPWFCYLDPNLATTAGAS